jgi:translation initiation factor IF-1
MSKVDLIPFNGEVVDVFAGGFFSVQLDRGDVLSVKLAGKLRKNKIKVILGDRVEVSCSVYDANNGMITKRL